MAVLSIWFLALLTTERPETEGVVRRAQALLFFSKGLANSAVWFWVNDLDKQVANSATSTTTSAPGSPTTSPTKRTVLLFRISSSPEDCTPCRTPSSWNMTSSASPLATRTIRPETGEFSIALSANIGISLLLFGVNSEQAGYPTNCPGDDGHCH